jgi:hypothetical protein
MKKFSESICMSDTLISASRKFRERVFSVMISRLKECSLLTSCGKDRMAHCSLEIEAEAISILGPNKILDLKLP